MDDGLAGGCSEYQTVNNRDEERKKVGTSLAMLTSKENTFIVDLPGFRSLTEIVRALFCIWRKYVTDNVDERISLHISI